MAAPAFPRGSGAVAPRRAGTFKPSPSYKSPLRPRAANMNVPRAANDNFKIPRGLPYSRFARPLLRALPYVGAAQTALELYQLWQLYQAYQQPVSEGWTGFSRVQERGYTLAGSLMTNLYSGSATRIPAPYASGADRFPAVIWYPDFPQAARGQYSQTLGRYTPNHTVFWNWNRNISSGAIREQWVRDLTTAPEHIPEYVAPQPERVPWAIPTPWPHELPGVSVPFIPAIDPMIIPPQIPGMVPSPAPRPIPVYPGAPNPTTRPDPDRSPTEQPEHGPAPNPRPRPRPGRNPMPYESPMIELNIQPGIVPVARVGYHVWKKPPPRTREKKRLAVPRVASAIVNAITEGMDLIEALYDALPRDYRYEWRRYGRTWTMKKKYADPIDQAKAVYDGIRNGDLDWLKAAKNAAYNEIVDRVIGKANQKAKEVAGGRNAMPSRIPDIKIPPKRFPQVHRHHP